MEPTDYKANDPSPGDRQFLLDAVVAFQLSQALHVAAELGIADLLASGPLSAAEIAERTGTLERPLFGLLRFLASHGVFDHLEGKRFAQTPRSELLRDEVSGSLRSTALYWGSWPWWAAWGRLSEVVRTGSSGFKIAHGEALFDFLEDHTDAAVLFNRFMAENPFRQLDLSQSYDFSAAKLIVDVGGGRGHHLASALKFNPKARGILFDLPRVLPDAETYLAAEGVGERCQAIGGSFFDQIPSAGDLYLLGNVLHDWDDDSCLAILRNCRRAISAEGRLLVLEALVPEGPGPAQGKRMDLVMLVGPGGLQRTKAELASLLQRSGFALTRVIGTGPEYSLIEAIPA